ncbi:nitroreductase family protein [Brevibacillus sp. SYSU BS000544]|uniref:nitroreductase family protein n=1 Tax=Brevibacillus sp. SYSU BS000544 TaxID=3416443 RepID=UPI003CE47587
MTVQTNQLSAIDIMKQRHSVKSYDASHQMPQEVLEGILTATTMAPSAWNLQHWKFLVIQDQAQKEKLLKIAYGQKQTVEASAVIAVLGDLEANRNAEQIYSAAVTSGMITEEIKQTLVSQINRAYESKETARDEANRNASLAAMQLMLAAKAYGYDTCPMGGFDREQLIEAFNIPTRYMPIMLISVGKAAKPAYPSSRFSLDQVVVKETF